MLGLAAQQQLPYPNSTTASENGFAKARSPGRNTKNGFEILLPGLQVLPKTSSSDSIQGYFDFSFLKTHVE